MAAEKIELRDYQKECIEKIKSKESGSFLVQMATGLGKTVTFANIPRRGRTLILSHRDELVHQPAKYFDCPVGFEKAEERSSGEEVVSASVQTLSSSKRLSEIFAPGEIDLLITDEAHHALAPTYRKVYDYLKPRLHVGFTATPNRGDGHGLSAVYSDIIFKRDIAWGISEGWLTDVDAVCVSVEWDISQVSTTAGDFAVGALSEAVDEPQTNEQVAEAWARLAQGQGIVFATSVQHAQDLAELIEDSAIIVGSTPQEERRQILRDFEDGRIRCLVNCGVLTEGTDLPNVETILLARPTKSPALYTQMVGRGLRPHVFDDGRVKGPLRLIDCGNASDRFSLCTPATLVGFREDELPQRSGKRRISEGLVSEMGKRAEEAAQEPQGWLLMCRTKDVTAGKIAWLPRPDGSRFVSGPDWSLSLSKEDLLGKAELTFSAVEPCGVATNVTESFEDLHAALMCARRLLEDNLEETDRNLWDGELARRWQGKPASERQLTFLDTLCEELNLDDSFMAEEAEGGGLSKREASCLISEFVARKDAEREACYGSCPNCGKPLKLSKSGKTLQCSSNRWALRGRDWYLADGCGYSRRVKKDGEKGGD